MVKYAYAEELERCTHLYTVKIFKVLPKISNSKKFQNKESVFSLAVKVSQELKKKGLKTTNSSNSEILLNFCRSLAFSAVSLQWEDAILSRLGRHFLDIKLATVLKSIPSCSCTQSKLYNLHITCICANYQNQSRKYSAIKIIRCSEIQRSYLLCRCNVTHNHKG